MENAIWFSRHQPTAEQVSEALSMGFRLVISMDAANTGTVPINDEADLLDVLDAIRRDVHAFGAKALFGVFPTPVQSELMEPGVPGTVPAYAAWNVQRTPEGGKPTFAHKKFLCVGHLNVSAFRG